MSRGAMDMAVTVTSDLVTAEDLSRLPKDGRRGELIYGEMRPVSPSAYYPGVVAENIAFALKCYLRTGSVRAVVSGAETGFRLTTQPDTVRAADVAVVLAERLPADLGEVGFFPGAPDLAVEVLSPTDSVAATLEKADFWLFHGAREVWVVDPKRKTVRVRRNGAPDRVLTATDTIEGPSWLPGFSAAVPELFRG